MKTNKDVFLGFNESLNNAILTNPDFKKVNASGNMKRSILDITNVVATDKSFIKYVAGYYEPIDKGRGRNRSNTGGLWQAIYEWLEFKKYNLNWNDEKERRSIAHAIVRNMAKKGSYKFRNTSAQTNIFESAIQATLPSLVKDLVTQKELSVRSNVVTAYRKK